MFGATFGYAAGWNPYASDYTRYLAPDTRKASVALFAGLGVFVSCTLLEIAGAAVVTAGDKEVGSERVHRRCCSTWLGKLVARLHLHRRHRGERDQRLLGVDVVHGDGRAVADAASRVPPSRSCSVLIGLRRRRSAA